MTSSGTMLLPRSSFFLLVGFALLFALQTALAQETSLAKLPWVKLYAHNNTGAYRIFVHPKTANTYFLFNDYWEYFDQGNHKEEPMTTEFGFPPTSSLNGENEVQQQPQPPKKLFYLTKHNKDGVREYQDVIHTMDDPVHRISEVSMTGDHNDENLYLAFRIGYNFVIEKRNAASGLLVWRKVFENRRIDHGGVLDHKSEYLYVASAETPGDGDWDIHQIRTKDGLETTRVENVLVAFRRHNDTFARGEIIRLFYDRRDDALVLVGYYKEGQFSRVMPEDDFVMKFHLDSAGGGKPAIQKRWTFYLADYANRSSSTCNIKIMDLLPHRNYYLLITVVKCYGFAYSMEWYAVKESSGELEWRREDVKFAALSTLTREHLPYGTVAATIDNDGNVYMAPRKLDKSREPLTLYCVYNLEGNQVYNYTLPAYTPLDEAANPDFRVVKMDFYDDGFTGKLVMTGAMTRLATVDFGPEAYDTNALPDWPHDWTTLFNSRYLFLTQTTLYERNWILPMTLGLAIGFVGFVIAIMAFLGVLLFITRRRKQATSAGKSAYDEQTPIDQQSEPFEKLGDDHL